MSKKFFPAVLIFLLLNFASCSFGAESLKNLFWRRAWPEMEAQFNSMKKKTAQDYALMANAYRFQNKWQEAVGLLEAHSKNFPASVRPYADMTRILAYENLNQTQTALALAEILYKNAPADLKYYIALAQYRIYDKNQDSKNSLAALNKMLANAGTDERKIYTLSRLIKFNTNNKTENALKLLELQGGSKEAAAVLSQVKNKNNNIKTALGVYYHTTGDNKKALEYLNTATGRKAQYYKAWCNSRLKQNDTALNLWGNLAISGNSYAASSVTRLGNLAKDKGMKEKTMKVLERIARERRGNVQARALQALINLMGKEESKSKEIYEAQILKSFPNTNFSFNILWSRAWENLRAGNAAEAVKLFRQADAPGVTFYKRARILYWLANAQKLAGQDKASQNTFNTLKNKYPLTIYGLLVNPKPKILDGTNPALNIKPSELEEWGFINHAYLKLSRPKATARELYRALILSKWLMTSSSTLYRSDLEALYPRPFKKLVDAAGKQYGVESNFVWAIMRQESAFNVNARSWVGAAGLMQFMPATAREEAKRAGIAHYDLYNANDSIRLGASHLATLKKSLGREEYVMAAYNAGSGNARKWLKNGGANVDLARWIEAVKISETNGYVQRVSANLEVYRLLYDGK